MIGNFRFLCGSFVLISLYVLLVTGCSDEAVPSESAAKAPYGPVSRDTIIEYTHERVDGSVLNVSSEVVGDKEIDGKTYWRGRFGDFSSKSSGMEAWLILKDESIVVAGGEFWSQKFLPNPNGDGPSIDVMLSSPVTLNLSPPPGEAQVVNTTGTVNILGQSFQTKVTGSYKMTEQDVAIETDAGTLYGCRRFVFEGSVDNSDILSILGTDKASGEVWYHPRLGFVKAVIHIKDKSDYVFDFVGTHEMGKAKSGVNRIQGMAVLDKLESFELNTYNVNGEFDADKDTHAKMLVEVRFLDEEKAKTNEQPPVELEFGTIFGIFLYELVSSPVSFFHPEENGKGFTYWYAYVDEAAKNQPKNGIAYHVKATVPDYGSKVRITSRIVYSLVSQ